MNFVLLAQRKEHFRAFVKVAMKVRSSNYKGVGGLLNYCCVLASTGCRNWTGKGGLGTECHGKTVFGSCEDYTASMVVHVREIRVRIIGEMTLRFANRNTRKKVCPLLVGPLKWLV